MTAAEWGNEPEHAVEAVRFLTAKFGHAPNYNMLVGATTLPGGALNGRTIARAVERGLLVEVDMPFGGCKYAYEVAEPGGAR